MIVLLLSIISHPFTIAIMDICSRLKTSSTAKTITALLSIFAVADQIQAQACAAGSAQELGGNWYCSEVEAIKYQSFPGHGSYNRVTGMDAATGQCTTEKHAYSGSLSPLNEEVCLALSLDSQEAAMLTDCQLSLHIRGPTRLKKLAVYSIADEAGSPHKRQLEDVLEGDYHHHGRNRHANLHHSAHTRQRQARAEAEKRAVGDSVVATIDGQVVSWRNTYAGLAAVPNHVPNKPADAVGNAPATLNSNADKGPTTAAVKEVSKASTGGQTSRTSYGGGSGWNRVAYYDAAGERADGLTFLNHFGGTNGIPGTAAGGPAYVDHLCVIVIVPS